MRVDVREQIDAANREVRDDDRDGKPAKVVIAGRVYATTSQNVWDAITDPARLARWFLPVSGELRLGGRYQLKDNAGGTITACEPPQRLVLTWEHGGDVSWVDVRIAPEPNDHCRVTLEHASIAGEHWEKFGPGAAGVGWDLAMLGLEQLLTEGRTVDPLAWPASDEGKDYIRRSADAWGRADLAAGADPSHARAAASRVATFYTGEGGGDPEL